tara:strand:- start:308 stop:541 length:234 start_codon:yes stop_codon:yes gene_type:complete
MNKNCFVNPITLGVTGLVAGGILFHATKTVYQKDKESEKVMTKPKLSDLNNWGAYLGLGIGMIYGYTKKPLINLLWK